jgi:formylglycine-generating enzyme required for sulfatase activity
MQTLSAKPLSSFSRQWVALPQEMKPIATTKLAVGSPAGMSQVPATDFLFRVNGIEIEGTNDEGVDMQYPGEASPRRFHELKVHIGAFWMDTYPVTNSDFKKFLDVTNYHPKDDHNFLRDWKNGNYPSGSQDKPVTWVSLDDARAYAAWAGKRLPHEWEWQYAAQGNDHRDYPWGNEWVTANAPTPDKGRIELPPSDVHAHPEGASPFGVQDLVGNVWQWTDEWTDQHTRSAILRGGSHYQPSGSQWYFPQAYKLSQHGKYLLMAPSLDRSASVGFRCVMDVAQ